MKKTLKYFIITVSILAVIIVSFFGWLLVTSFFANRNRENAIKMLYDIQGVKSVEILEDDTLFSSSIDLDLKILFADGKNIVVNGVNERLDVNYLVRIGDCKTNVFRYRLLENGKPYATSGTPMETPLLSYFIDLRINNVFDIMSNYESIYEYVSNLPDSQSEKYIDISHSHTLEFFDEDMGLHIYEWEGNKYVIMKSSLSKYDYYYP
jgi:hypothetical protein